MMDVNLTDLLIFFDEQLPISDEEQRYYWFRSVRADGVSVDMSISLYDHHVTVGVDHGQGVGLVTLFMKDCSQIRVLDQQRKCLEIIHEGGGGRCFLALSGSPIVEYTE